MLRIMVSGSDVITSSSDIVNGRDFQDLVRMTFL